MSILDAYKRGWKVPDIAELTRDGFSFHDSQNAFFLFDEVEATGESDCHMVYIHNAKLHRIKTRGYNALNAKKLAVRQRAQEIANTPLAKAVKYGYSKEQANRYLDAGYRYEYGCFIRRIKVADGYYRTLFAFLTDGGDLRETMAVGATVPQSLKRGYGYIRRIKKHGSLITSFHVDLRAAIAMQMSEAA